MSGRLQGKVIAVTGASGIAASSARRFGREGAKVFVVSRDPGECEALAGEINASGGVCQWAAADLTDDAAAKDAFAVAFRFAPLDGLLAVAGGSGRRFGDGPLHEIPLEGWEATLRINGFPLFLAARETIRHMVSNGRGGSIVIISSVLATSPSPELFGTHAYAAVKGSALSLVTPLASYYAKDRIRVNAIAPGLVDTPMSARAAKDPATMAYAARKQPLVKGMIDPDEIAAAALFFLSDEAAAITGQVLDVDGGWSVTEAAISY